MSDTITAYPLTWPPGKPRTRVADRRFGQFGKQVARAAGPSTYRTKSSITEHQAIARIREQADRFTRRSQEWRINPEEIIFSTNLKVKNDGTPYAGQRRPDDPGVAVYFDFDGKSCCIAVDTYTTVADNLAAVAAVLEALRALERHGSGMLEAAFTGFTALPAPGAIVVADWRRVLGVDGTNLVAARAAYMRLRAEHHPDRGGDPTTFNTVCRAWDQARAELDNLP